MPNERPLVSIITPAYNSSKFIEDAIESVVLQTFKSWEMIIVDDASSDSTVQLVSTWMKREPRIKLIENTSNLGPGPSRNCALGIARGRYVAFLDSDDVWLAEKLERQISLISKTRAPMVFSSYSVIDEDGQDVGKIISAPSSVSYAYLLSNTVIGCLTVLVDREKVSDLRMPDIPSRQPLVLWLSILRNYGDAKGLDEVLAKYRVRPSSISSNKFLAARQVWNVYRNYEGLNFITSICHFIRYAINGLLRNRSILKNRFF
ncbi:glycosyltransferase family 2 protein [Marinobacter sp. OP 3.4]|uniref:glycosyltransferase family 2 protein n=1 Tax=Marinobacter sp. OP 3.4 TaxID=3076501 RepID=UPI002E217576